MRKGKKRKKKKRNKKKKRKKKKKKKREGRWLKKDFLLKCSFKRVITLSCIIYGEFS